MMKTKQQLQWNYDAVACKLTALRNGKPAGGFIGQEAEEQFAKLLDSGVEIRITASDMKKEKVRKLRALWHKQGIDHIREAIIEPYGVQSTSELKEAELDELIERFTQKKQVADDVRSWRSVILKQLTQMGVYDNGDWTRVNEFMMDRRIAGRMLYELNVEELKALSVKLRSIANKLETIQAENARLAKNN
jgi:ribosomal protein S13